jgi:ketosteroid isomerase-like protein
MHMTGHITSTKQTSVEDNARIVKDAYAAFGRGDIPGLLAMLAEDVEWQNPGGDYPLAGTYRGRNEVTNFIQKILQDFDILGLEPREFVAQGNRVLVAGWERATVKATNQNYEADWIHAFTVRNGKIAKFREYTDTLAIAAAHGSVARVPQARAVVGDL